MTAKENPQVIPPSTVSNPSFFNRQTLAPHSRLTPKQGGSRTAPTGCRMKGLRHDGRQDGARGLSSVGNASLKVGRTRSNFPLREARRPYGKTRRPESQTLFSRAANAPSSIAIESAIAVTGLTEKFVQGGEAARQVQSGGHSASNSALMSRTRVGRLVSTTFQTSRSSTSAYL